MYQFVTRIQEIITRDKKMQDNLIVITTTVALVIAIFISTSDAEQIQRSSGNPPPTACGPCQDNSNFSYVFVLRGRYNQRSYMYIDLSSPSGSHNVVAKKYANPLDIRGKALHNYMHTKDAYNLQ